MAARTIPEYLFLVKNNVCNFSWIYILRSDLCKQVQYSGGHSWDIRPNQVCEWGNSIPHLWKVWRIWTYLSNLRCTYVTPTRVMVKVKRTKNRTAFSCNLHAETQLVYISWLSRNVDSRLPNVIQNDGQQRETVIMEPTICRQLVSEPVLQNEIFGQV